MKHHPLCPKRKLILKKCQCGLIDKVIVEYSSILDILVPQNSSMKSRWYYSGRMDAAEDIEEKMHENPCDCDHCKILVIAYKAALGE